MTKQIRISFISLILLIFLYLAFAYTQFCVVYDDVHGWDYAAYAHAAGYVADGESPYNEALYIYPPTLAILLVPFSYLGRETGFWIWTIISLAAYLYSIYRAAYFGQSS